MIDRVSYSDAPGPGIYENLPFEAYHAWPYLSNSRLTHAAKSMAHYKHSLTHDVEETDAMRLGSLVHSGRLEPLSIVHRYAMLPAFEDRIRKKDGSTYEKPKATSAYKDLVAEFRENHRDKTVVTEDQYKAMEQLVTSLCEHRKANEWLNGAGPVEVSIVWDDPTTGVRCKGRLDKWNKAAGLVVDLKTTFDLFAFGRNMYVRGYHRQGAFYCDGIEVLTGHRPSFAIVAAETSAPFTVQAAPLSETAMKMGRESYRNLLKQIAEATINNDWPGPSDPEVWDVPGWAKQDEPLVLTAGGQTFVL